MAEPQPSKLVMRVRFPSPAPVITAGQPRELPRLSFRSGLTDRTTIAPRESATAARRYAPCVPGRRRVPGPDQPWLAGVERRGRSLGSPWRPWLPPPPAPTMPVRSKPPPPGTGPADASWQPVPAERVAQAVAVHGATLRLAYDREPTTRTGLRRRGRPPRSAAVDVAPSASERRSGAGPMGHPPDTLFVPHSSEYRTRHLG